MMMKLQDYGESFTVGVYTISVLWSLSLLSMIWFLEPKEVGLIYCTIGSFFLVAFLYSRRVTLGIIPISGLMLLITMTNSTSEDIWVGFLTAFSVMFPWIVLHLRINLHLHTKALSNKMGTFSVWYMFFFCTIACSKVMGTIGETMDTGVDQLSITTLVGCIALQTSFIYLILDRPKNKEV